jgi:hypothetical protein
VTSKIILSNTLFTITFPSIFSGCSHLGARTREQDHNDTVICHSIASTSVSKWG